MDLAKLSWTRGSKLFCCRVYKYGPDRVRIEGT